MIRFALAHPKTGKITPTGLNPAGEEELLTHTWAKANGLWTSYSATLNGTATLINCLISQAIGLTDIIVNVEKVATTSTIYFYDGTNTANIWKANTKDSSISVATSVGGRVDGWSNANVILNTTGATIISVTLGYYNIPKSNTKTYSEWLNSRTSPT